MTPSMTTGMTTGTIAITRFLSFGALAICILLSANITDLRQAHAQESLRISAVVNETAISVYDLVARTKMIAIMSNLPQTNDTLKRLRGDTLRALIDESLKLQEAEKFGLVASQDDINQALSIIEQRNKMSPDQLPSMLSSKGIDIETLFQQIKTNILWPRVVMSRYRSSIEISDTAINTAVEKAESAQEQPLYQLSEIIIPIENISQTQQAKKQILRLSADLINGADFSALARSFSHSPSAPKGGDIGWLRFDQIPAEIKSAVTSLRPGQISPPIQLTTTFAIIKLRDYRKNSKIQISSPILNLSQVHIELPGDAPQSTVEAYMASAKKSTMGTTECEGFAQAGSKLGSDLSGNLGDIIQSNLPQHLSDAVSKLAVGTPSAPIRTGDGIIVLMVCKRTVPKAIENIIDRDKIVAQLLNQRMAIYARQYLRQLRREAYIDIRQ